MSKAKTDAIRWLQMRGLVVTPCYKTQTIMVGGGARWDWADVFDYDWEALYAQCVKWQSGIEAGKLAPWEKPTK